MLHTSKQAPRCPTALTSRSNTRAQALGGGSRFEGERAEDVKEDTPVYLFREGRRHQGRHRASHGMPHQRKFVPAQGPCLDKRNNHNRKRGIFRSHFARQRQKRRTSHACRGEGGRGCVPVFVGCPTGPLSMQTGTVSTPGKKHSERLFLMASV